MTQARVFISYSHKDTAEKDLLLSHLRVLERGQVLQPVDAWDDSRIGLGEDWRQKISDALNEAHIAILLVTANFLTSDFILQEEVRVILERHKSDLIIIPVIARHCPWQEVDWLSRLNIFNSGRPVWDGDANVDKVLADIAREVAGYARRRAGARPQGGDAATAPAAPAAPAVTYTHVLFVYAAPGRDEERKGLAALPLLGRWFRPKPKPPLTPQLLELVRAVLSETADEGARHYVCHASGGGVVVATFEDPQGLLRFALWAAPRLGRSSLPNLRMGLHSAAVGPETLSDSSGVPVHGIDTARRLALLGLDGHILASQEAAGFLRRDGATADCQFEPAPRRELTPGGAADVFNVYGPQAGNRQPPPDKVSECVVRRIKIPRRMRALLEARIRLEFCAEVAYVKTRFEFEGNQKPVRVSCGKPQVGDCTFEYDFESQGESREQTFTLAADNPEEDSLVTVRVHFSDEYGRPLAAPAERRTLIYRKPPPPKDYKEVVAFFLWLWDRVRRLPLPVQFAIPAAALVLFYLFLPTCRKEELKVALWLWRKPYVGEWKDDFYGEERSTLPGRWSFDAGQLEVVAGDGDESDGALWLKAPGAVLVDKIGSKRFYDFDINFKARFRQGDKIAWLLRARPDGQRGYLFVLERKDRLLVLRGFKQLGPNDCSEFDTQSRAVPIEWCCHPDDAFNISVEARGYLFTIGVAVQNLNEEDPDAFRGGVNSKTPFLLAGFEDEEKLFRSGTVGPVVWPDTSWVLEKWLIKDAHLCSPAGNAGGPAAASPPPSGTQ
ncbi:MAG TPA: toll/interleukin-1 receptor domain-containing protein [Pyrinomonadaceae bacterium]|jgi:hypothetical protein